MKRYAFKLTWIAWEEISSDPKTLEFFKRELQHAVNEEPGCRLVSVEPEAVRRPGCFVGRPLWAVWWMVEET